MYISREYCVKKLKSNWVLTKNWIWLTVMRLKPRDPWTAFYCLSYSVGRPAVRRSLLKTTIYLSEFYQLETLDFYGPIPGSDHFKGIPISEFSPFKTLFTFSTYARDTLVGNLGCLTFPADLPSVYRFANSILSRFFNSHATKNEKSVHWHFPFNKLSKIENHFFGDRCH